MAKKRVKRRRKKIYLPKVQTIFCILSTVFILGCMVYYGNRLIKYYKIYNPKSENGEILVNLASNIIDSERVVETGDGLYSINGNYVYKGANVDNYLLLNNMLFRIIKINGDKTIDIVSDEYINKVMWNETITDYSNSNIKKYLNSKVLSLFDKDNLVKTSYCSDKVYELSEISCEETNNEDYIRLLGINDYLNSLNDNKTYLNSGNEYDWLHNAGKNNAWHTTGSYISNSSPSNLYGVRFVLTLKNSLTYSKGDGSELNPYIIDNNKEEIKVGSYLDINDNIYIVYEVGDKYLKVESNDILKDKLAFDTKSSSYETSTIKKYLEETYLKKLKCDEFLTEVDFNGVKSQIGLLSVDDFKFNSSLNNYYLSDKEKDEVVVYNGSVTTSEPKTKRNIRYALGIKKDLKIISGNGSSYAPFIVEVK